MKNRKEKDVDLLDADVYRLISSMTNKEFFDYMAKNSAAFEKLINNIEKDKDNNKKE